MTQYMWLLHLRLFTVKFSLDKIFELLAHHDRWVGFAVCKQFLDILVQSLVEHFQNHNGQQ